MSTTIATTTARLAHVVRVRHASTGAAIAPLTARLSGAPHGWWLRVRGGDVVVVRRDGSPTPATVPTVTVSVADRLLAPVLVDSTAQLPLDAPQRTVTLAPVPMTLTVELWTPVTGAPRTGAAVRAQATSGPTSAATVDLTEVSPGLYRSAPTTWTSVLTPLQLLVDGDPLRQLTVDFTRTDTHVRLVDTT